MMLKKVKIIVTKAINHNNFNEMHGWQILILLFKFIYDVRLKTLKIIRFH